MLKIDTLGLKIATWGLKIDQNSFKKHLIFFCRLLLI